MKKRKVVVFDGLTSIPHVMLGLLTRILAEFIPTLSLIITAVYITYQALEKEPSMNKLGDFIEFITGYIIGDLLTANTAYIHNI